MPLCDPSQKGWDLDSPQEHQKYTPGSTFSTIGVFWAILGSDMFARLSWDNMGLGVAVAQLSRGFSWVLGPGFPDCGAHFQTQPVETDKAGGVILIVGFGGVGFHCGDVGIVETLW